MQFEETELRLGLPGNGGGSEGEVMRKRGFSQTDSLAEESVVDLKLNLSSGEANGPDPNEMAKNLKKESSDLSDPAKPPAKAQVVGWPPVRSFRKNMLAVQKNSTEESEEKSNGSNSNNSAAFIKVSMDGAPYLRKVDLRMYKCYSDLSDSLGKMFSAFTIGNCGSQGIKDFLNKSKLVDLLSGSEYVATYEDKDGDWMLVGDVPWEMFAESCKRLRIMKGKEAIGLDKFDDIILMGSGGVYSKTEIFYQMAPRAMEKCKNRN